MEEKNTYHLHTPTGARAHGEGDENIPAATNAVPLSEALKKAGGAVNLELFPNVGHDVCGIGRPIEERLKAFFAAHL